MAITPITEDAPILPIGLHIVSLEDLEEICVRRFTGSTTRNQLMTGLRYVVERLMGCGITADIWINGSFLTEKQNPNDVDMVLRIPIQIIDNGTHEQRELVDWVGSNLKRDHYCDSYVYVVYPEGHQCATYSVYMDAYWIRQFGFSRGQQTKGIAVLEIGGSS